MEEQLPELKPFDIPHLQLPSYEEFGRRAGDVLERQGDKLVPRKPTLQEEMQMFGERNQYQPNLQNEVGKYSRAEAEGFTNPNLPYDPSLNMVDIYAKYDPATWGKSFEKLWDTTVNNSLSGYKNLYHGLKEGITEGRISAVWDNEYSRHLAEVTENLEKMKPLYFSEDDNGASAFLKQLLPSVGYVASSVAEMAATHLALTVGGAAIGAVVGEGVGAVPGVIAGNLAAFVKDAQTLKNMVTGIGNAARAMNAMSTANKIKTGAQLIGSGLFHSNGEASLNAQLASRNLLETKKRDYYERTGRYLSGEALNAAQEDADHTGSTVFSLNLPLIAASNILQFGNLLRGRFAPSVAEKLAFGIDETGKAVAKSSLLKVGGKYALDSSAEGFEELAQGVIEDATVRHFSKLEENRKSYLSEFADSAYKRAASKEGAQEFLGGALIGGVFNLPDLAGVRSVQQNTKRFVDDYNQSTHNYFHSLADAANTSNRLKRAILSGDQEQIKKLTEDHVIDMVNSHSKAGSTQAFSDTLEAMDDMDTAEFNRTFGLNLSEQEKVSLVQSSLDNYKKVVKIREDIDTAYQVNPFGREDWFNRQLNKFRSEFNVDRKAANAVWDIFKDTLTHNTVKYDETIGRLGDLETVGPNVHPDFGTLVGTDPSEIVRDYKEKLRQTISATLPGYQRDQRLLDRLESGDPTSQYATIIAEEEKSNPGLTEFVADYNRQLILSDLLLSKNRKLNSRKGQRKEIKRIIDYMRALEAKIIEEGSGIPVPAPVAPTTVTTTAPIPQSPAQVRAPVVPPTPVTPVEPETMSGEDEETPEDFLFDGDYASFFGEGATEETSLPVAPVVEEPLPVAPIVDPLEDLYIAVDEPRLSGEIERLEEGESLDLVNEKVNLTYKGKRIKRISKKGDTFVGATEEGPVALPENFLAASEIEATEDTVGRYKAENNLNETQSLFLDNLLENYAEIIC